MRALIVAVFAVTTFVRAEALEPTESVVFFSGDDGYHTYRIPSLVTTPEGALVAICEGRKSGPKDDGDIDLVMKRSDDGGRDLE